MICGPGRLGSTAAAAMHVRIFAAASRARPCEEVPGSPAAQGWMTPAFAGADRRAATVGTGLVWTTAVIAAALWSGITVTIDTVPGR